MIYELPLYFLSLCFHYCQKGDIMKNQVHPVNILKTLGITKEQYARMGSGEIMALVRLYYSLQANEQSNLTK